MLCSSPLLFKTLHFVGAIQFVAASRGKQVIAYALAPRSQRHDRLKKSTKLKHSSLTLANY